jgi:HEAT repeat protein
MVALGQFGSGADAAVPALAELLKGKDDEDRKQAGELLAKIGKPSVFVLIEALRDDRPEVRLAGCETLAAIGPDARLAVDKLMGLNRDKSFEVREAAKKALEKIQAK